MTAPLCRKAVVAEDGRSIDLCVDGEAWWAVPGERRLWTAVGPTAVPGFGESLWDAIKDSRDRRAREEQASEARP